LPRTIVTLCVLACVVAGIAVAPASADLPAPTGVPTLFTRPGELLGHTLRFRGALPVSQAGSTLQVQRQEPDGTWTQTATTTIAPDGTFIARWRTDQIGSFTVRALVAGAQAQTADASTPTTSVTIYRPARATWFGPGFYGRHTACGQVMSHALLGVAHRTLPCGTPVAIFYDGKSITVPVIDRGPFANGARYDLTSGVAQTLGMKQTSTVGVVPQRGAQMAPPAPAPSPYATTGGTLPTSP
jgi:rare lipoprotein A (peptidoglycan hydrolase)